MLKKLIKEKARSIGFCGVGITSATPVDCARYLENAAKAGRVAEMDWLSREPERRCDPRSLLKDARSVICCALEYGDRGLSPLLCKEGPGEVDSENIARFARGEDYHKVVGNKLKEILEEIKKHEPNVRAKVCVDTSPIVEKALAERAGLGWIGKHTILLNEKFGSWFVLGEIVTDLKLKPDAPAKDLCGDCTKCIDACPTGAILEPKILDARKCISYLTIEKNRKALRSRYLAISLSCEKYGCDICQEACPFNKDVIAGDRMERGNPAKTVASTKNLKYQ